MLCLQVVMGYSHSMVIARQDTDQEKEKLKKLPEYNPRTLWSDPGQQLLNPFYWSRDQRRSAGTLLVPVGRGRGEGGRSQVQKQSTYLNYQQTGPTPIWTRKPRWDWRRTRARDVFTTSSEPAAVRSEHFTPSSRASQNPSPFCNTAKCSCLLSRLFCFFLFSIWNDSGHIYGCYSRTLRRFLLRAFQRPTLHSCAFFYVCVQDMEVFSCSDQSDFMSYMAVWAGACRRHRLQSGFGTWCSDLVHSTRCYIPFIVFSVCIKDAHLSPPETHSVY